jgi:hypothetical protein
MQCRHHSISLAASPASPAKLPHFIGIKADVALCGGLIKSFLGTTSNRFHSLPFSSRENKRFLLVHKRHAASGHAHTDLYSYSALS